MTTDTDLVVDELHGVRIEDRFRWLEAEASPRTREWVAEQNARTEAYLGSVPGREALRARLADLLSGGMVGAPTPRGSRNFFMRRNRGQQQAALLMRRGAEGPKTELIDPNALDPEGLLTLDWWYPSNDGTLLAYGLSRGGDEWSTLHVLEVDTGRVRDDRIARTRACSLAWLPDNGGFYYTRYPEPGTVPPGDENYHKHVFRHRLGDDPADDPDVWGEGRHPQEFPGVQLSRDGRYLVVVASLGWSRSEIHVRDLAEPDGAFRPAVTGVEARYDVQLVGEQMWVHTNQDAPNDRLLVAELARPEREHWREVIPEGEHALQQARIVGEVIGGLYLVNAASQVRLFGLDGQPRGAIELPPLGTVDMLRGEGTGRDLTFGFTSFTVPTRTYRHDTLTGTTTLFDESTTLANTTDVDVRQVWYPSKDGTPVSMFVVHRRGLELNGKNPALLTGYGGFNISRTPIFNASSQAWIERGGVWALPNLRGGGEYGERWHEAGRLERKQNVFDDFIAAAKWLIAQGYTRPEGLAIRGGSNGGLLVGAAMTQRPELCRAVVCQVPLLDMVRYHRFSIARLWIPEYGSAEDPEAFAYLHAYSPYHRVEPGRRYPAVLFTTAEGDSRVDPLHARKMAALMQAVAAPDPERPILLRVEAQAGHGVGKPVYKAVAEETDIWTFIASQVGLPLVDARDR